MDILWEEEGYLRCDALVVSSPPSWYVPPKRRVGTIEANWVRVDAIYIRRVNEVLEHPRVVDRRRNNLFKGS